jgi:hypothetical protein
MPLRMADLGKAERTVTLIYDGESVDVTYRPNLLNTSTRLRLMRGPLLDNAMDADSVEDSIESYFDDVARVLVSWDVVDAKGKQLPPSAALMADLPQEFIRAVLNAITKDAGMVPTKGGASPATSEPEES